MAAKPITLNVRDVALAAKKAYDEGRLSAQGPTPECQYRDRSDLPCAIGAALHTRTARRFDDAALDGTSVQDLSDARLVVTDDLAALQRLQSAHDSWAGSRGEPRVRAEAEFVETLDSILARKVGVWPMAREGKQGVSVSQGFAPSGDAGPVARATGEAGGSGGFTPGPWRLSVLGDARPHGISAPGWPICFVSHYGYANPNAAATQTANARLIAASPHLFEALERITAATMNSTNSETVAEYQSWVRAVANTALAAATGEA